MEFLYMVAVVLVLGFTSHIFFYKRIRKTEIWIACLSTAIYLAVVQGYLWIAFELTTVLKGTGLDFGHAAEGLIVLWLVSTIVSLAFALFTIVAAIRNRKELVK